MSKKIIHISALLTCIAFIGCGGGGTDAQNNNTNIQSSDLKSENISESITINNIKKYLNEDYDILLDINFSENFNANLIKDAISIKNKNNEDVAFEIVKQNKNILTIKADLKQNQQNTLTFKGVLKVVEADKIIYVSSNGTGDGTKWNTPTNIKNALDKSDENTSIWLKNGTFSITEMLVLKNGASIYGGFSGSEQSLKERNISNSQTIFTKSDDAALPINIDRHISLINIDNVNNSLFDTLKFQNITIDDSDSIIRISDSNMSLKNITFKNNNSHSCTALYVKNSKLNIKNATFLKNHSQQIGGAMCVYEQSNVNIHNASFSENASANNLAGALYVNDSNISIEHSSFTNNQSVKNGTSIFLDHSHANIKNSIFSKHDSPNNNDIIYISKPDEHDVVDKTFVANVTNSIFTENHDLISKKINYEKVIFVNNFKQGLKIPDQIYINKNDVKNETVELTEENKTTNGISHTYYKINNPLYKDYVKF